MQFPYFGRPTWILALGATVWTAAALAQGVGTLQAHLHSGLQGEARRACLAQYGALEKELISGIGMTPAVIRSQSANDFLARKFRYTIMQDGRTSRFASVPPDEYGDCVGQECTPWDALRSHAVPFDGGSFVYHCPLSARRIYPFQDACVDKAGRPMKSLTRTAVYLGTRKRQAQAEALTEASGLEKTFRGQEIVIDRLGVRAQAPLGSDGIRHEIFVFGATKINGRAADLFLEEFLPAECQRPRSVGPVLTELIPSPRGPSNSASAAR